MLYEDSLFIYGSSSDIVIDNMNLVNGHFTEGSIDFSDTKPYKIGNILIKNSRYKKIYSDNGPIIQVKYLNMNYNRDIIFDNVTIEDTEAKYYGGVIYSLSEYTNDIVSFINCTFINNKANYGTICHSYNINSEPRISNKNEILEIEGHKAFSTNPTGLIVDENNKQIDILSGDILSDEIR
eukprot:jgi/Orpsp1_1/1174186/evm.model.c7180000049193.1